MAWLTDIFRHPDDRFVQAAKNGDIGRLRQLIERGANVDARDKDQQWTALMCALDAEHVECAQYLVESGADVNAAAETGTTPLMIAAVKGNVQAVETLLRAGANALATEMHGRTALDLVNVMSQTLHEDNDQWRNIHKLLDGPTSAASKEFEAQGWRFFRDNLGDWRWSREAAATGASYDTPWRGPACSSLGATVRHARQHGYRGPDHGGTAA